MHEATWLRAFGTEIFVECAGEGVPVLCVHTAGQSGVQYREVIEQLPRYGYRVIVPDLPGHGRSSPWPGGPITDLHTYAEICWEIAGEMSLNRTVLLGCSIGGKIALDLCVHHSPDIRGAIVMEADAHNSLLSVSGLRRSMNDAASPSQGDRTYLGTLASLGHSIPAERARSIADMHRREDALITTSDLLGWTTHDVTDGLSSIECPVLVVAGRDDFWVQEEDCRKVADAITEGHFLGLDGVGHYPMEELASFPETLAGWLEGLLEKNTTE